MCGSRRISIASNGPSGSGSWMNVRSRSPVSTCRTSAPSSLSDSCTSTCGCANENRNITSGSTRAPTLWYVPTRNDPAFPSCNAARSARAARPLDQAIADQALERRDLLADGGLRVAQPDRGAAEAALLRHRLQGSQVPQFDPEPTIRFHDQLPVWWVYVRLPGP